MRLLVLDTETTGLDPKQHKIIELAAAIYCTKSKEVIAQFGTLFYHEGNPCLEINMISQDMLDHFKNKDRTSDLERLKMLCGMSDFIVAHNAKFDHGMCAADPQFSFLMDKPWVCSKESLKYPKERSSRSLAHLAADHGIFNPGAHRAIYDVLTLCQLMGHCVDIEEQILNAMLPRQTAVALVKYDERELAKEAGFGWNGETKRWEKKVTEKEFDELSKKVLFQTVLTGEKKVGL